MLLFTLLLQDALKELTGKGTVPQVFIKGEFIGGGSETSSLHETGQLQEMLISQGIISKEDR